MMHVSMMMVSYSTLIIGSLLSILYLSFCYAKYFTKNKIENQNNESLNNLETSLNSSGFSSVSIKKIELSKKEESNSKLSLLQTIDTWSYRIIGLGFPFLTIGIISGAIWANEAWGSYWSWDPKETWALITWITFAIYLHARLIKGWQGEKAAIVGSCGFLVVWICYLGVNFLGKGLHSYGWVIN
jgi:cytochrome c-type biogenesis protein CcsB